MTTMSRSRGSSAKRCGISIIGISTVPGSRAASSSHFSRTSSTSGGEGESSSALSAAGAISVMPGDVAILNSERKGRGAARIDQRINAGLEQHRAFPLAVADTPQQSGFLNRRIADDSKQAAALGQQRAKALIGQRHRAGHYDNFVQTAQRAA